MSQFALHLQHYQQVTRKIPKRHKAFSYNTIFLSTFLSKQTLIEIMCIFFYATRQKQKILTARHSFRTFLHSPHLQYLVHPNFICIQKLFQSQCFSCFQLFFLFKTLNHQHFLNYALLSLSSLSTFFLNVYWRRYI